MIFAKNFCKKLWKKIILGTSDAWSLSLSSKRPSDLAYYIEDCQIYCSLLEELKLAKETNLSNPKPQKGIYSSSGRLANLVAQNVCNLNKVWHFRPYLSTYSVKPWYEALYEAIKCFVFKTLCSKTITEKQIQQILSYIETRLKLLSLCHPGCTEF